MVIPSLGPPRLPPVWHAASAWRRDLGVGLAGLGAAVVVVGGVLGLQAVLQARDVRSQCGDASTCPNQAAVHEHNLGNTYADWSTALIPLGLATAAVGVFVLATTHGSFEPSVSAGQARLDARWTW